MKKGNLKYPQQKTTKNFLITVGKSYSTADGHTTKKGGTNQKPMPKTKRK